MGDATATAVHMPIVAFAAYLGVPWEVIALMVPRLRPHARKVEEIVESARKARDHDDPEDDA